MRGTPPPTLRPGEVFVTPLDAPVFTTQARASRRATQGPRRYRISAPLLATDGSPLGIERNRAAAVNVRAHSVRALGRVVSLAAIDLGTFALMRAAVRAARLGFPVEHAITGYVITRLPAGYLGGSQFAVALLLALVVTGSYGPGDRRRSAHRIVAACALATLLPLWLHLWVSPLLVAQQFAVTASMLSAVLLAARLGLDALLVRYAPTPLARAVVVGTRNDWGSETERATTEARLGVSFVGFVDVGDTSSCRIAELRQMLADARADTVLLRSTLDDVTYRAVVRSAMMAECRVLSATRRLDIAGLRPTIVWRRGKPMVELRAVTLRWQQLVLKRLLDVVGAALLLVVFAPLMAVVAVAVRRSGPGPVLYGQRRLGRHGRSFTCYKFRSMFTDAEQRLRDDQALHAEYVRNDYKLPDGSDPRITPVGRFLRRTSLDELPQLWNVLKGDMSLVGPRPIVPDEIRHYEQDGQMLLLLKPGLTGLWQVSGRSNLAYPARAGLELEYVEEWKLSHDIAILLRTVPAVLMQRGAH